MSVRAATPGRRANGRPGSGAYVYRGSLPAVPAGEAPPPTTERVLAVLSALGGSATVPEIRRYTVDAGDPLTGPQAGEALRTLSHRDPAPVAAIGSSVGGGGRARLWYLTAASAPVGERAALAAPEMLAWPKSRLAARNSRALRRRAGLTQEQAARWAGIGQATLGAFEVCTQRLSTDRAGALARVLGTTLGELTGERCAICMYLPEARGHKVTCGGEAS